MILRPRLNTPLRTMLPWGYQKEVVKILGLEYNQRSCTLISQALTGKWRRRKRRLEVMEAIHWVALQNLMDKIFKL